MSSSIVEQASHEETEVIKAGVGAYWPDLSRGYWTDFVLDSPFQFIFDGEMFSNGGWKIWPIILVIIV